MTGAHHRVEPLEFGAESDVLLDRESVVATWVASHAPQTLVDREDLSECSRRRRRRGRRLAFHAPSWRIRSRSPSVMIARMSLVRDIVRLYDVARLAAGPPGVPSETRRNRFATRFEAFSAFDYRAPVTPRELPQVRVRKPWWHPAHRRHLGIGPIRLHELEQPCPRARTWSPHHRAWLCFRLLSCARGSPSRSPAEGSTHAHAGKILRDHRGPW